MLKKWKNVKEIAEYYKTNNLCRIYKAIKMNVKHKGFYLYI